VAKAQHGIIRPGDTEMEAFFTKLAYTPFRYPVRLVFDYTALAMLRYSFRDGVRLFRDTLARISDIQAAVLEGGVA
jgi:hypothetical protein